MQTKTNGKIPVEVIEDYKSRIRDLFPGERKEHSETDTTVLCPVHEADDKKHKPSIGADLRENGKGYKIVLNCRSQECGYSEILKAANITQSDLLIKVEEPDGCTLEQYACHKGLDKAYLAGDEVGLQDDYYAGKPAVRIPYYSEDCEYLEGYDRWRISPVKVGDEHPVRSGSKKYGGGKLTLYGRWWLPEAREAGYVLVVEGESDCHTAWSMGYKAVGVPGVNNWRDEWARFFDGIEKIYVVVEDAAGETLWKMMFACDALRERLYKVAL